jgi:hypothetical protein
VLDDLWNANYNDSEELLSPFIDGKLEAGRLQKSVADCQ